MQKSFTPFCQQSLAEERISSTVFPVKEKLSEDDSSQQIVTDVSIQFRFDQRLPDVPQILEEQQISSAIARKMLRTLAQEIARNEAHPMEQLSNLPLLGRPSWECSVSCLQIADAPNIFGLIGVLVAGPSHQTVWLQGDEQRRLYEIPR